MELLKRLEQRVIELWKMASVARGAIERQRLLEQHRQLYQQYRRHKIWLNEMES